MCKILNSWSPEIMKDIFKAKVKLTTIILWIHSYFPKEMFKQLDMDYRPYLTLVLIFLGPCTQRYEGSYYSEWIQGQNQNLEVRKLSLPTLQNLPFIERLHYMSFNMSFNADYLCLIKSEEDCQWQYKCCCDMYQR